MNIFYIHYKPFLVGVFFKGGSSTYYQIRLLLHTILHVSERTKNKIKKVFTLVIDEDNEPIIVEEVEILEDILNGLASISNRIDDIQLSLIKNDDVDPSSDLDISKIDF